MKDSNTPNQHNQAPAYGPVATTLAVTRASGSVAALAAIVRELASEFEPP